MPQKPPELNYAYPLFTGHVLYCMKFLMSSGAVVDFSSDFQSWYISQKWYPLTSEAKRHFTNRLKFMNAHCTYNPLMNVTVYDNSTLIQVAEYCDKIIMHDLSDTFRYSGSG
jgi:hypothetical protein